MNNPRANSASAHMIRTEERKSMLITEVDDVISFDESTVILGSSLGVITVEGEGLHILKMSVEDKEVIIEGKINGFYYIDKSVRKGSPFRRK